MEPLKTIVDEDQAGGDLEEFTGLLSPGFINCHCHLELSHLKDLIPENQGLVNFVLSVMSQRRSAGGIETGGHSGSRIRYAGAGIVAVGDICNTSDTVFLKQQNALATTILLSFWAGLPGNGTVQV